MLERLWRKGNPAILVGGKANWCSHYGEQYEGRFLRKLRIELPCDPAISGIYLVNTIIQKDMYAPPYS